MTTLADFTLADFTPAELRTIESELNYTWNAIGGDLLSVEGRMTRDHVIECALDGDYLEMYGGDQVLVAKFRKLPMSEQRKVAERVFTYDSYVF